MCLLAVLGSQGTVVKSTAAMSFHLSWGLIRNWLMHKGGERLLGAYKHPRVATDEDGTKFSIKFLLFNFFIIIIWSVGETQNKLLFGTCRVTFLMNVVEYTKRLTGAGREDARKRGYNWFDLFSWLAEKDRALLLWLVRKLVWVDRGFLFYNQSAKGKQSHFVVDQKWL